MTSVRRSPIQLPNTREEYKTNLQVVLQHSGEVVLQLVTTEMGENILPIGRVLLRVKDQPGGPRKSKSKSKKKKPKKTNAEAAKVRFQLTSKNLDGGRFTNTVGTNKTENLTWARGGKTVELELVGTISVGCVLGQVLGQINNLNGLEGALLHTDTTTNAKSFRDAAYLRIWGNFNAQFSCKQNANNKT
jgi:hypothetical protein